MKIFCIAKTHQSMTVKRRKVNKACVNCSKWHVSCDDTRPCNRCVKKGLQESCVDAPRKRSKYLDGIPNGIIQNTSSNNINTNTGSLNQTISTKNNHITSHASSDMKSHTNSQSQLNNIFMSNAVSSEYSMLSNILHKDIENTPTTSISPTPSTGSHVNVNEHLGSKYANIPPQPYPSSSQNVYSILLGSHGQEVVNNQINLFTNHHPLVPVGIEGQDNLSFKRLIPIEPSSRYSMSIRQNNKINQFYLNNESLTFPEVITDSMLNDKNIANKPKQEHHQLSVSLECKETSIQNNPDWEHSLRYSSPMEIYTLINEPFSHTPGFHHLLMYLRSRFNKEDIVEMCRCMSQFRPIFIACSITLTEEDMIFMEQCYQRTLLEYAKFLNQIGTPTCVWRRNGQISYVNEEFEILTGWTRFELLNKMTFIVEILDDQSVRDYFKTFSNIAFKDFEGSEIMKRCKILSPIKGKLINCCCMWTLKRDISGLPLMILGNFMPIL